MAPPTCGDSLWRMILERPFDWVGCVPAEHAGGFLTVGFVLYLAIAIILFNWMESWYPPAVWTAIFSFVFIAFLPPGPAKYVIAMVIAGVGITFWYMWQSWSDSTPY